MWNVPTIGRMPVGFAWAMPRAGWHCFMSMQRLYAIPSVASCARCASLSQDGINGLELRALKNSIIEKKASSRG